jgi:hypothetical protein
VDDHFYAFESTPEPLRVPNIADEEPHSWIMIQFGGELELLELIPTQDDDPGWVMLGECATHEPSAE